MIDTNTIVGAGMAVLASKDLINKVLGPTADYIGEEIKHLVQKSNANLSVIFTCATRKLGQKIDHPGSVNPRVFKQIWDEGRFIEDELAAEYFGGLLASARSPDGKDDRILSVLSTVRDLSVFDLRLHYLIYVSIRRLFVGRSFSVAVQEDRVQAGIFIPFDVYCQVLGLKNGPSAQELAAHSLITLIKHEMIDHRFSMGPPEKIKQYCIKADRPGIIVIPSFFGAELFLWAHGYSDRHINELLSTDIEFPIQAGIVVPEGAIPMTVLEHAQRENSADPKSRAAD